MLLIALAACSSTDPVVDPPLTDSAAPVGPTLPLGDWVDGLRGDWVGLALGTPFGDLPFGITFVEQDDGVVGVASAYGFSLSLSFLETAQGWTFVERGEFGGAVQEYTLLPVAYDGTMVRFEQADPTFLTVVVDTADDRLVLDVQLRGEPHCTLDLRPVQ